VFRSQEGGKLGTDSLREINPVVLVPALNEVSTPLLLDCLQISASRSVGLKWHDMLHMPVESCFSSALKNVTAAVSLIGGFKGASLLL
jgi:hypothetical protein